jgi:uncharacterized Zn-finger protein
MAVSETTSPPTRESGKMEANAAPQYEVTRADLPLCCPMPQMELWNSHPRVYLPIENTGKERCPYCGAIFVLKD